MPNFSIARYHGNTLILPVALTDSQDPPHPLVITGATINFQLGTITQSSDGYSIVRDDEAGTFIITISAALMETLILDKYNFAAQIIYASGVKETLFVGHLVLMDGVIL
ncbi:MAG: hypothetical protein ACYDG4_15260 [Desulfuromonadaceae bacterium]